MHKEEISKTIVDETKHCFGGSSTRICNTDREPPFFPINLRVPLTNEAIKRLIFWFPLCLRDFVAE